MFKRWSMLMVVLALALGSAGVFTVRAATNSPSFHVKQQSGDGAWLGIEIQDADNGVAVISVVPDSPADTAGLLAGDVITAVDGTAVDSAQALSEAIAGHQSGDSVTLSVSTGDEARDVTVTLGERPANLPESGTQQGGHMGGMGNGNNRHGILSLLGVTVEVSDQGVTITSLDDDSPLADLGFQEGDVITAVNGTAVDDLNGQTLMETLRSGGKVTVTVQRDGAEQDIEVDLSQIDLPDFNMPDFNMPNMQDGMNSFMQMMPPMGGSLGVSFVTLTSDVAAERNLDVTEGALIEDVQADSPAEKAGLQVGDIVTAVDGDKVDEEHTLRDRMVAYEEGDVVTLSVTRDGANQDIEVTVGPSMFRGMMGQGMQNMMPFFYMIPGGEQFFQDHPFMNPMMPNGGMHNGNGMGPGNNNGNGGGSNNSQPQQDAAPATSGTAA